MGTPGGHVRGSLFRTPRVTMFPVRSQKQLWAVAETRTRAGHSAEKANHFFLPGALVGNEWGA